MSDGVHLDAQPIAPPRRFLSLVGASGSGKTVIGRRTAEQAAWALYDTDAQILAWSNTSRISDIFDQHGEAHFRALETRCLEAAAQIGSRVVIATGGGLPAIPGAMGRLNELGVTVYLKASLDTLWKRVNTDPRQMDDRPLLRSGGKEALARLLEVRETIYAQASVTLDTEQLSVDEVCALLRAQIASMESAAAVG